MKAGAPADRLAAREVEEGGGAAAAASELRVGGWCVSAVSAAWRGAVLHRSPELLDLPFHFLHLLDELLLRRLEIVRPAPIPLTPDRHAAAFSSVSDLGTREARSTPLLQFCDETAVSRGTHAMGESVVTLPQDSNMSIAKQAPGTRFRCGTRTIAAGPLRTANQEPM